MNLAVRKPMSLAEFLAWEERQELKHEFDGFRPVAMTGGTLAHAKIQRNLAVALSLRLRGKPCEFLGNDIKIRTAEDHIRYPDGMITCSPGANTATIAPDPVIVFEVLGPSTAATDRIVKAREYQAMPSVQRYVMIEQDRVGVTVYTRAVGDWRHEILADGAVLSLPEVEVELPVSELYAGLAFDAQDDS